MSERRLEGFLVALLFLVIGIGGIAYGTRDWAPPLASRHGAGIDAMLRYLLITTGLLFLAGHLVLAALIWRACGRRTVDRRLASRRTEVSFGVVLGVVMAAIAEGGVLAIGIPVWNEYFAAEPPADAVLIEVTGKQFEWTVRYPGPDGRFGRTSPTLIDDVTNPLGLDRSDGAAVDDVVTTNELYGPVNRPIRLRLRSRDVIHSFFLPHFRVKQDVVPGMTPEVVFVPTREGRYEAACTELCGLGHYRMQATFTVVSESDYERWLREQTATP
jgi:cytochrome c oxidase subunit 2